MPRLTARKLAGEVTIMLGGQPHVLRPSFQALYAIEQRSRLTIRGLLALLCAHGLPASALRIIAEEGLAASGYIPDDLDLSDERLKPAAHTLRNFLLYGLGCALDDPRAPLDAATIRALAVPDWHDLYKTFTGMMGRAGHEFWQTTLPEYWLTYEGFFAMHGLESLQHGAPATSADLAELMERFPDSSKIPVTQ
jgi:hypothetical protein